MGNNTRQSLVAACAAVIMMMSASAFAGVCKIGDRESKRHVRFPTEEIVVG
jgi:hypothetical protein